MPQLWIQQDDQERPWAVGLAETLGVARACQAAASLAVYAEPYAFGTTPPLLARAMPSALMVADLPASVRRLETLDAPEPSCKPVMAVTGAGTGCDGNL
jgi:hypothetical protein